MAPVKFDDLQKVATEELNDDYQTSGYVLKAKQKTNLKGVVLSHHVDVFDKTHPTAAKITWKIPGIGCEHFAIDKLEMDKGGKFKLEVSSDKIYPKLKVECKSDLADYNKVSVGCTYTGIPDAQVKFECKAMNPMDFNGEATYAHGMATYGFKFNNSILKGGLPEVGLRLKSGPLFCALLAKNKLDTITAAAVYKACPVSNLAATYDHNRKTNVGNLTVGVSWKGMIKAKVSQDQSVCVSAKHSLAKGFGLLGAVKYSHNRSGGLTWGLQLSVE